MKLLYSMHKSRIFDALNEKPFIKQEPAAKLMCGGGQCICTDVPRQVLP